MLLGQPGACKLNRLEHQFFEGVYTYLGIRLFLEAQNGIGATKAYYKAIKVINSCNTSDQLFSSVQYYKLYKTLYPDEVTNIAMLKVIFTKKFRNLKHTKS